MIEAELPDGTVLEFPEGTAPAVVQKAVKSHLGVKESPGANDRGGLLQNIAGGILRGAGSIGTTMMTPIDAAARAVGVQNDYIGRTDRREAMDNALRTAGVDTDSLGFKGAKLGTEIAGTAGAGGALAKGVSAIPAVASKAPLLAEALKTGGLSLGGTTGSVVKDLALRTGAGAANGAATAALVNPNDADTGAFIGGLVPGGVKTAAALGSALKNGASALVKNTLGASTGAGAEAVGTAYQAGKRGSVDFLDNMRGNVPMEEVLGKAKAALGQMRQDRGNAYRSGMAAVSGDKTVIPFAPIEQAMNKLKSMGSYKGQVINKNAAASVDELDSIVSQWKGLDPAEYHTPEGLDALKKAIGDVRDSLQFGTPARSAADGVYNAVKNEILDQAPTYSKVMKDYQEASQLVSEIERTLSQGQKASADTAMRKLQSLMRNNVNTNYGNRLDLARQLEQKGGQSILDDVAGQALNSVTPRGLQGGVNAGALLAAYPTGGASLAAMPLTSPRLVGEAAYALGSVGRKAGEGASAANQKLAALLKQANLPSLQGMPKLERETMLQLLAATPAVASTQR